LNAKADNLTLGDASIRPIKRFKELLKEKNPEKKRTPKRKIGSGFPIEQLTRKNLCDQIIFVFTWQAYLNIKAANTFFASSEDNSLSS
jgi:hypothetical protein